RARTIVRRHGQGNPASHRADERHRAPFVPRREPLPEYGEVRERQTRVVHEKTDEEITVSLNFLATRFRCSWPWDILVMLCDGRVVCGCADPYGHRVLGDARRGSVRDTWT